MPSPLSRRSFLAFLAAGAAAGVAGGCSSGDTGSSPASGGSTAPAAGSTAANPTTTMPVPNLAGPPFTLGVASGDPLPDRVVLWTRLAPKPLDGGGMPDQPVPVVWEVAADDSFAAVFRSGVTTAEPKWGHSVHVDVDGLDPDRWYSYRFRVGEHTSPAGRTRTAPAAGAAPKDGRFRFGFASCQEWTTGLYTAYPHLVEEQLDLMVWLGDYIYESGVGSDSSLRKHNSATVTTLIDYRNRYALYSGDPSLQAARAALPWIVLWDDHEVANNYADDEDKAKSPNFLDRRAAAYQAWWENQPVRMAPPGGPDLQIYRTLAWGSLANFFVLDQRQYRSHQICDNRLDVGACAERDDPTRTLLGTEQRDWFFGELDRTTARWNVIANEVIMTRMPLSIGEGTSFNLDQWDGFPAEQTQVMKKFASRPDLNPLVITGDIHAYGMADLHADFDDPGSPVVGSEFVGGSITSFFPTSGSARDLIKDATNVRFVDGAKHGYAVMELSETGAQCRFRAVDSVREAPSPISTLAEFTVEPGRPGARQL